MLMAWASQVRPPFKRYFRVAVCQHVRVLVARAASWYEAIPPGSSPTCRIRRLTTDVMIDVTDYRALGRQSVTPRRVGVIRRCEARYGIPCPVMSREVLARGGAHLFVVVARPHRLPSPRRLPRVHATRLEWLTEFGNSRHIAQRLPI